MLPRAGLPASLVAHLVTPITLRKMFVGRFSPCRPLGTSGKPAEQDFDQLRGSGSLLRQKLGDPELVDVVMSGRLPFVVFELLGARETVEISGHCAPASRGNRERNRKFADSFAGGDWIRIFGSARRYASVSDSSTVTACLGLSPRRRLRFTIRRASLRLVLAEGDPYLDLPVLPSPSRCGPCWRRPRPNLPR